MDQNSCASFYDLILVVDQAFEDYTFERECLTPAALPGMFDRTVTVFSFSKGMGLSGMRVGYIVCSDQIMDSMYANYTDYEKWCKKTGKSKSYKTTATDFIHRLQTGRLVKDKMTGELIVKRPRKKK